MTLAQEVHLTEILESISKQVNSKYRVGQEEHGGDLWKRSPLVDDLIEEAIDQITYALTLKSQLTQGKQLLEEARNAAPDKPVSAQKLITRAMTYL